MAEIKVPGTGAGADQNEKRADYASAVVSEEQEFECDDPEAKKSGAGGGSDASAREEANAGEAESNEALRKLLQQKEEEVKEKHDRWLRAQADLENFKKRSAREKADLLKFGNEQLMKELLSVLDNFERSLNHARTAQDTESLVEGVELVRKSLLTALERFGLKEIRSGGEKFDPTRHEATVRLETAEHPEGTVVEEFQKGYFIHDRLLRPALVAVAAAPASSGRADEQ